MIKFYNKIQFIFCLLMVISFQIDANIFFDRAISSLNNIEYLKCSDNLQQEDCIQGQDLVVTQTLKEQEEVKGDSYQDAINPIDCEQQSVDEKKESPAKDLVRFKDSDDYKQLKYLFVQIVRKDFSCNRISNYGLENLFRKINKTKDDFFTKDFNQHFDEENLDRLRLFFDDLNKGISYELCYKHLFIFREHLLNQLHELIKIIDYWQARYQQTSFVEELQTSFSSPSKEILAKKIQKLNFYKNRLASFLGKTDEIGVVLFSPNFREDCLQENYDLLEKVTLDCINSICLFFENNSEFDTNYFDGHEERILFLIKDFDFQGFSNILCANHINLPFMHKNFEYYVNGDNIPSFFRRHWLLLSCLGVGTAAGGAYVYHNWDWLMGDQPDSTKNMCVNFGKKSYNFTIDSWNHLCGMVKNKFSVAEDESSTVVLGQHRQAFEASYEELYNNLSQHDDLRVYLTQANKKSMAAILEAIKKVQGKLGNDNGVAKANIETLRETTTKLQLDWKSLTDIINEELKNVNSGEKIDTGRIVRFFGGKASTEAEDLLTKFFIKKKRIDNGKADVKVEADLMKLVYDLVGLLVGFELHINDGSLLGSLIQLLGYRLAIDILAVTEQNLKTAEITLNWAALLPITCAAIIVFVSTCYVVKKIIRDKRNKRYNNVNYIVGQIYRILTGYKSNVLDYYLNELKYKDQGMLSYWIECLNKKIKTVSKEDKVKLFKLIQDLQCSDFTISQKIEFIRLEWGKYLFGSSFVA